MRPEKRYRIVSNAIGYYLDGKSHKLYNTNTLKALQESLEWCRQDLKRIYNEDREPLGEFVLDTRNGYDTYGYLSKESIMNNMFYIWDRWCCEFRINWLIDGIINREF